MQPPDPVAQALANQFAPQRSPLPPEEELKLWRERIRKGWTYDPRKF